MYSRLTADIGETIKENILKPVGPYRIHSSDCMGSVVQTTDVCGIVRSISISPIQYPTIRERDKTFCQSQSEDFEMLMWRHKPTLDLLAR